MHAMMHAGVRGLLQGYSLKQWEKLNMEAQVLAGGGETVADHGAPGFSELDN